MANIQQEPLIIDDFSSGVLKNVGVYKMPETAVPHAINFVFDENVGEATLRKGTTMIGNQIVDDKAVLGLTNFRDGDSTNHALLAVVSDGSNNDIYKATTWSKSLTDDTKDLKTRFIQFLDSIVRLNGTDANKSFDGSSWISTGGVFDLANMPTGKYGINYKDRVHVISDDGILYSSSVPKYILNYDAQSSNFTAGATLTGGTSEATGLIIKDSDSGTTGTLELIDVVGTFTNNETITDNASTPGSASANGTGSYQVRWKSVSNDTTKDYIVTPIDPDNGEKGKCTGLGKVGGLMLIFFERAMYTWNGKSTEADEIVGIGCSSQESVAVDKENGILFFANENGIFMTKGGYPQKISRFQQAFFDNMSSDNYQHIAGGCDGKHYFCSIGDVTLENKTTSNVVIRYTIQSQEFADLSYPTQPRVFSQYIDSNDVKLVYGDNDGNVIQIDSSATADNFSSTTSKAIEYELDTADIYKPMKGVKKSINGKIFVHTRESSGAKFLMRFDKNTNRNEDWITLGEIKKENQEFKKLPPNNFKYVRFKITGRSKTGRLVLEAIEIPNWILTGY